MNSINEKTPAATGVFGTTATHRFRKVGTSMMPDDLILRNQAGWATQVDRAVRRCHEAAQSTFSYMDLIPESVRSSS